MWSAILLMLGVGAMAAPAPAPVDDYSRSFGSDAIEPDDLARERYGKPDAISIEPDGLRIRVEPGDEETGWKPPPTLRIVGNVTITAEIELRSLPVPTREDGVAVGLSLATQTLDQPDATLVRLVEPDGSAAYRVVHQPRNVAQHHQQAMMAAPAMNRPGARPDTPPRPTFPAEGDSFRLVIQREESTVRYRVLDPGSDTLRDLAQMRIGPADLIGLKVFALNRNGEEPLEVLIRSLTIHADRLQGLGTAVRTISGEVVYGEPMGLSDGNLLLGSAAPSGAPSSSPQPVNPATGAIQMMEKVRIRGMQGVVVERNAIVQMDAPVFVEGVLNGTIVEEASPQTPDPASPPTDSPQDPGVEVNVEPAPPEPKRAVPLDEIDSIRFERPVALAARLRGQPNVDLTGPHPSVTQAVEGAEEGRETPSEVPAGGEQPLPPPGTVVPVVASPRPAPSRVANAPRAEPEPNGIRDLHVSLSGLRDADIRQITISCPTDEGQASWRLDTRGSTDWPLVLRRHERNPDADLFLEPPPGDCHQKPFQIMITYADQQSAGVSFQADQHTDASLAYDPQGPDTSSGFDARVFLVDGQQMTGMLMDMDEETLTLAPSWPGNEEMAIPLDRVRGVLSGAISRKETEGSFSRRLEQRQDEDLLLARTRAGEVIPILGILEGIDEDRIRILYQDESRTVALRLVEGFVLADGPTPDEPGEQAEPIVVVALEDDQVVSGFWREIAGEAWTIETAWGASLAVPTGSVQSVRVRGGRMTYLSDLEPTSVEQTPYFGRLMPWSRDANLRGGPLTVDGQTFERGLAVHSRCVLTYDLGGRFDTFETLVGFDDEAGGLGRVDCRVLADDEELFSQPDLRADAPPTPLRLSVKGARTLRLVVDFGPDQDAGDRIIWADARLYREPPEQP